MKDKLNICIVGGGNSTHSLIPLLSNSGHDVSLLTRNPGKWSSEVSMEYTDMLGNVLDTLVGSLKQASDIPEDLIPQADVILLSLPVSKYRLILNTIAPYIDRGKKVYVGTIYGQGGFNWMMEQVIQDYELSNIAYFAIGLLPWITRTKVYGEIGINYGSKAVNVIAVKPQSEFKALKDNLLDSLCFNYFGKGEFMLSSLFLALTLSVDNQIIHLSRLYGLFKTHGGIWSDQISVPLFYRDFDDVSAKIMQKLDADYSKIREALISIYPQKDFSFMLDYLGLERLSYSSSNSDIKESFVTSSTLGLIPTPTVKNPEGLYIFDKDHRFFTDDLYYGLVIAKWFAINLHLETPMLDEIIHWAQDFIRDTVLADNKLVMPTDNTEYRSGNPDVYRYDCFDDYIS